jgi:hypothetical protein
MIRTAHLKSSKEKKIINYVISVQDISKNNQNIPQNPHELLRDPN